jgi:hypothetical protein
MTHEFQGKTINVLCVVFVLVLPTSTAKPIFFMEASLFLFLATRLLFLLHKWLVVNINRSFTRLH